MSAFATRFDFGFFSGKYATSLVPGLYPVALGGHPYLLDDDMAQRFHRHTTVPDLTTAYLVNDEVGEKALNPGIAWRRTQTSWHLGAGQRHFDSPDSTTSRFWQSKGVNPWVRDHLTLLPDVIPARVTTDTTTRLTTCGDYVYASDNREVYWSLDMSSWTAVGIQHGETAQPVLDLTSSGAKVFAALGPNGIHSTSRGTSTSGHYCDLQADHLIWAKSRLLASLGPALYDVKDNGTLPTAPSALFTHPNSDFTWVAFADGDRAIYAAGHSGDHSQVYRIGVLSDGSGLAVPIPTVALPDGEIVSGLSSYLGFVLIGTSKGVRLAISDSGGDLTLGPLIKTGSPVRCFEGQDRYVWFGWSDYDGDSTGLGRMDLGQFNDSVPAYASDLMASAHGDVTAVVTNADGRRVFAVAGTGIYVESDIDLVASGSLDTGLLSFQIADQKVALSVISRYYEPVGGDHVVYLAGDSGEFVSLGSTVARAASARQMRSDVYEIRHVLLSNQTPGPTSAGGTGPDLRRWTMAVQAAPAGAVTITVPLLLSAVDMMPNGSKRDRDPRAELAYLKDLREGRSIVTYQEGADTLAVTLRDFEWLPIKQTVDGKAFEGTFLATLITATLAWTT